MGRIVICPRFADRLARKRTLFWSKFFSRARRRLHQFPCDLCFNFLFFFPRVLSIAMWVSSQSPPLVAFKRFLREIFLDVIHPSLFLAFLFLSLSFHFHHTSCHTTLIFPRDMDIPYDNLLRYLHDVHCSSESFILDLIQNVS